MRRTDGHHAKNKQEVLCFILQAITHEHRLRPLEHQPSREGMKERPHLPYRPAVWLRNIKCADKKMFKEPNKEGSPENFYGLLIRLSKCLNSPL